MIDEEEDWGRVKIGRFSDADEKVVRRIMGPWFPRRAKGGSTPQFSKVRKPSRQSQRDFRIVQCADRIHTVSQGYAYSPGRQAVVKVGFCPKSIRGVLHQVCYVARLREEDLAEGTYGSVPLSDGFGVRVMSEDALDVAQSWDLATDDENRSKAARELLRQDDNSAFQKLGGREQLRNIQAWHFTLSIEEDGSDEAVEEQFRAAVRGTVDEAFTAKGHKVMWGIHKGHTGHIHAHVIVRAVSDLGGRVHSDIQGDYLHSLRTMFARNLKLTGLEYEATRRLDRRPLRERIMAGYDPVNNNRKPWRTGQGAAAPYENLGTWRALFGDQALEGLEQLNAARSAVREKTHELSDKQRITTAAKVLREHLDDLYKNASWMKRQLGRLSWKHGEDKAAAEYGALFEVFGKMYHDPQHAIASWQHMAMDGARRDAKGTAIYPNLSLANWTLRHRPEMFGEVRAAAFERLDHKRLRKILRKAWLPSPERVPVVDGHGGAFMEHRVMARIHKDRLKTVVGLKRLLHRVETEHKNPWWEENLRTAIQQTERILIGQVLPKVQCVEQEVTTPVFRIPSADITNTGAEKDIMAAFASGNENEKLAEERSEKTSRISATTKKTGRGR